MRQKRLTAVSPRQGRARRLDPSILTIAAAELVDRDGPENLTLAGLADALGVKPPSLYAHVESLQQIKSRIAVLGLKELELEIARASVGKSGPDAVRAICWAYRNYAERRPGVYFATVAWTPNDDDDVEAAGNLLKSTVLSVIARPAKRKAAPPEQIHLLRMLRISLHGFVSLKMANAFGEPVDPEETFRRLVERLAMIVTD